VSLFADEAVGEAFSGGQEAAEIKPALDPEKIRATFYRGWEWEKASPSARQGSKLQLDAARSPSKSNAC
jgi:hypothetical protein